MQLEACALFYEHYKFGIGLGIMRGGSSIGENLVAGPETFRLQYLQLAAQALLQKQANPWRGISVRAPVDHCIEVMGPETAIPHVFGHENTAQAYRWKVLTIAMLAGMGPRTRRSLAGKRRKLEENAHVSFLPSLEPAQALEAMLILQPRSMEKRVTRFYHARYRLLQQVPRILLVWVCAFLTAHG